MGSITHHRGSGQVHESKQSRRVKPQSESGHSDLSWAHQHFIRITFIKRKISGRDEFLDWAWQEFNITPIKCALAYWFIVFHLHSGFQTFQNRSIHPSVHASIYPFIHPSICLSTILFQLESPLTSPVSHLDKPFLPWINYLHRQPLQSLCIGVQARQPY